MSSSTLWNLEPHTLGKHKVLRGYLDAWLPIMAKRNDRILFIDGFAGPGEYEGGEPGSPLIAINALRQHQAKKAFNAEVGFIFVEKDQGRFEHLTSLVDPLRKTLPTNSWVDMQHGSFDAQLKIVLDQVDAQAANLAPSFVMVDPFGVSGTPMSVISRILQNPKSETYISFQYEAKNRFKETSEFERHLDELFGTEKWHEGLTIEYPPARKAFFYSLYEEQLRLAGAEQVLYFELMEGRRLVYTIFFGTKHVLGSDRMKQAIWKVAPWGDYVFRPVTGGQLAFGIDVDLNPLMDTVEREFRGRGWVTIEQVTAFVQSDRTIYHSGHLKRGTLIPMEDDGRVEVDDSTRNRKKTYPEGTRLRIRN